MTCGSSRAATCSDMPPAGAANFIPVRDYDLSATLTSGQAFRWTLREGAWEGVIGRRWVRLHSLDDGIEAHTPAPVEDWSWLMEYLQTHVDLGSILLTFPDDEPMRASVAACRGLRLLRQDGLLTPLALIAALALAASGLISDMAERSHSAQTLRQLPQLGARFLRLCFELALTTAGLIWFDLV